MEAFLGKAVDLKAIDEAWLLKAVPLGWAYFNMPITDEFLRIREWQNYMKSERAHFAVADNNRRPCLIDFTANRWGEIYEPYFTAFHQ